MSFRDSGETACDAVMPPAAGVCGRNSVCRAYGNMQEFRMFP